jgi:hypothetical protein
METQTAARALEKDQKEIPRGASAVLASGTMSMIDQVIGTLQGRSRTVRNLSRAMSVASADLRLLAGLGGTTPGILALRRIAPLTATIIGVLALGAVTLFETISFSAGFANLAMKRR